MNEKYYPLDPSGEDMAPLVMDCQALLGQLDVCGRMVSYVNEYVEHDEVRAHLNRATYEIKHAVIALQKEAAEEE